MKYTCATLHWEWETSLCAASLIDCFSAVFSDLADSSLELYVLIHNLDSQMLRGERSQQILAQLSSLPSIYLIASIDHINAPLSEFPWAWFSQEKDLCSALGLLSMFHKLMCCLLCITICMYYC